MLLLIHLMPVSSLSQVSFQLYCLLTLVPGSAQQWEWLLAGSRGSLSVVCDYVVSCFVCVLLCFQSRMRCVPSSKLAQELPVWETGQASRFALWICGGCHGEALQQECILWKFGVLQSGASCFVAVMTDRGFCLHFNAK